MGDEAVMERAREIIALDDAQNWGGPREMVRLARALSASESAREEAIRERDAGWEWYRKRAIELEAIWKNRAESAESALAAARARIADLERACGMSLEMIPATLDAHRNTAQADHEYAERVEKERAATLMAIADQPCATEAVRDDGKRCPDSFPHTPGEWCIGCVARAALASTGDAGVDATGPRSVHVYGPGCTTGHCVICDTWHCMSHLVPGTLSSADCPARHGWEPVALPAEMNEARARTRSAEAALRTQNDLAVERLNRAVAAEARVGSLRESLAECLGELETAIRRLSEAGLVPQAINYRNREKWAALAFRDAGKVEPT